MLRNIINTRLMYMNTGSDERQNAMNTGSDERQNAMSRVFHHLYGIEESTARQIASRLESIMEEYHNTWRETGEGLNVKQEFEKVSQDILKKQVGNGKTLGDILGTHAWSEAALHDHAQEIINIFSTQPEKPEQSLGSQIAERFARTSEEDGNQDDYQTAIDNLLTSHLHLHNPNGELPNTLVKDMQHNVANSLEGAYAKTLASQYDKSQMSIRDVLHTKGISEDEIGNMFKSAMEEYFGRHNNRSVTTEARIKNMTESFHHADLHESISIQLATLYEEHFSRLEPYWHKVEAIHQYGLDYKQAETIVNYLYSQKDAHNSKVTLMEHLKATLKSST